MKLKKNVTIIISSIVLAVGFYTAFIIWSVWPISMGNLDKAGAFGDSFGFLTSLFSGLAFAGIIITISLQRDELTLQRKELELTREELKLTRGELSTQNETSKLQAFENTFFQMLRAHNELLESIDLSKTTGVFSKGGGYERITKGRDCFSYFYTDLEEYYSEINREKPSIDEMTQISLSYEELWSRNGRQELAHYFRHLYSLFKFVEARAPDENFYSKIIRSQLSDQEMLLLFYNCLTEHGNEKFKPLIEKYAVFNNLPKGCLLDESHADFFATSAYDWL
jgi:hypothetical protein